MDELIEPDASTRRGLLRALARTATRHTRDGAAALGPGGLEALLAGDQPPRAQSEEAAAPIVPPMPARVPARAAARAASLDELLALAHGEGLTQRDDGLRALARRSLRMTPIEPGHADAWILTADDWGATGDEVLLALIHLAATSTHDCSLPGEGWLALFVESWDGSTGSKASRAHGVSLDTPAAIPNGAEPVALSSELVIPRRWHEAAQALEFDDGEADAYDRLRTRLQVLQGLENDDDGGLRIAYHRLLGYPNETTGNMPPQCARAQRERSAADEVETDPGAPALPSREWQLLAQISVGRLRRAYVWIHQTDLEVGDFGHLWAFVR